MNVKSKGLTLNVNIDDDPMHPRRDCDNLGIILSWHKKYEFSDINPYESPRDFNKDKKTQDKIFTKFNLYLLDHSGLRLSASPFTAVDAQGWDSGQIGYIIATKDDVMKAYGNLSEETKIDVNRTLLGEIEDYNSYLTGNYYCFTIEDEEGEEIDSCGSFTGDSMIDILEDMKENASEKHGFLFDKIIDKQSHAGIAFEKDERYKNEIQI